MGSLVLGSKEKTFTKNWKMLVFLSLISAVASAPYVLYSGLVPQYTPYHVPYGAHHYAVVPQVAQVAPVPQAQVVDPMNYAVTSAYPIPNTPQETNARLITVSSLQTAAGTLMEHAAGSAEITALMTASLGVHRNHCEGQ